MSSGHQLNILPHELQERQKSHYGNTTMAIPMYHFGVVPWQCLTSILTKPRLAVSMAPQPFQGYFTQAKFPIALFSSPQPTPFQERTSHPHNCDVTGNAPYFVSLPTSYAHPKAGPPHSLTTTRPQKNLHPDKAATPASLLPLAVYRCSCSTPGAAQLRSCAGRRSDCR